MRTTWLLSIAAIAIPLPVSPLQAQSAAEHHLWQDRRTFQPFSRTAQSITGAISLSGNPAFATKGSNMSVTLGKGKVVQLTSVGASWRQWDVSSEQKVTAEVFKIVEDDPGALLNGNTLCGDPKTHRARYIVFFENSSLGGHPLLDTAVFRSSKPPLDINSDGLCGTFSYSID